jgi:D-aspartate ligase
VDSEPSLLDKRLSKIQPPVLLASPSYGGTIAAVRDLGRNGIDVRILSDRYLLGAAAWSRYASRSYHTPPESKTSKFLERLLSIGASEPAQVLLPTSDETAWLYSANATLLQKHFYIHQPPIATMRSVLDKKLLSNAATKAGIAVLPTWAPGGLDDLTALASSVNYPIVIKPRTHVHQLRNDKGFVVHSPSELIREYKKRVVESRVPITNGTLPDVDELPILQQFVTVGREGVRSVTGFRSRRGDLFATRHAVKVFQRTEPLGVGVCFEAAPSLQALSEAVRHLCETIGFFGIFEVEFVWLDGRWNLIDFNPRMFNQMAIDISRGLSLPFLSYLDAIGDAESLNAAVASAQRERRHHKAILYDSFTLRAILLAKAITSRTTYKEHAHWKSWMDANSSDSIDIAADSDDPMPGIIHAISEVQLGLKAFPQFLRKQRASMSNGAIQKTAAL